VRFASGIRLTCNFSSFSIYIHKGYLRCSVHHFPKKQNDIRIKTKKKCTDVEKTDPNNMQINCRQQATDQFGLQFFQQ
jgi:hypothetical protein